jgi:hypothetical protein
MTNQLHDSVAALLATARAENPTCPGWQLTMNPDTYLMFNPDRIVTGITQLKVGSFYDGCRVWPEPTWEDTVVCSPLVDPGTWDLPPEYYLDLCDNTISTTPPLHTRTIRPAQGGSLG